MLLTCRVSFREASSFRYFLHHPKREQVEALNAGVVYDEGICKIARELYAKAIKKTTRVMLGASCSVAAYDKVRRDAGRDDEVQVRACSYYEALVVPGWQHIR